ncbi:DUF7844 domain-containing protein [Bdellovibrio svalbardensis]|uniref:DUF4105 domain-containing protein n=1 Tax=Bdellovibrio svalbardensis TaxID=2972972 RepID=A0ABT6DLI2_9BACT|nr:DUF4105 domain-containing protein [Bdellovibrio svalbardensis]MDG0816769.1 DUF4105 domain-containing protein [Bdellovibrio svalbardensis]
MKKHLYLYIVSSLISGLFASVGLAMPRFTIEGSTLTSAQKTQIAGQFVSAYELLPPIMRIRLEGRIKFDHYQLKAIPMEAHVAGEVNKDGIIQINSNLLNKPELVTRILVHELSHVYDFLKVIPQDIRSQIRDCEIWKDHYRDYGVPDSCELYQKTRTTVSTMPDFLDAAGWYQTLNGKGLRIDNTTFGFRSPDPYEATNPKEMFAVNMEYFLTDREYQCRRPSLYRYLAKHFSYQPFGEQACPKTLAFVDPQFDKAQQAIRVINPNRVYAIHYLLAGSGEGIMSAFGHSMVRVIMCAPERTTVGPECLKDIQHHIVLSFRAFVDSPQINGWAGLTGAYASRLFFIPFPQIINEYNISELRDLFSYPLALSREQIQSFLERAVETHWSYNSNYYFLSNNCAVEIMNLFKAGIANPSLMNSREQTPKSVLFELKRKNMISNEVDFENLENAKERGYYFTSYEKTLDQALSVIRTLSGQKYSIKKWAEMDPEERRALYGSVRFGDSGSYRKWSAAFLFLERYLEKQVTQSTYNRFLQGDIDQKSEAGQQTKKYVDSILKIFTFDQELTGPSSLVKAGYGIPSQPELSQVQEYLYKIKERRDQNLSQVDLLLKKLIQLYGADEIEQTRANIAMFAQGMKVN